MTSPNDSAALRVANEVMRLSSQRYFDRQLQSAPPEGRLFHYTTVSGLQGIVETNCLHASAAYFLDDSSEIEYGRRLLNEVLEQWELDNPEARDDVTAELIRDVRANLCEDKGRETLVPSVHVASFCEQDN